MILALDLEGTLISDVYSCIPRPGLREFLDQLPPLFQRIVIFTAASPRETRAAIEEVVDSGDAPAWLASCEIVDWSGDRAGTHTKDLRFVHADPTQVLIVDDHPEMFMHPGQEAQWVEIASWDGGSGNGELERVMAELRRCARG